MLWFRLIFCIWCWVTAAEEQWFVDDTRGTSNAATDTPYPKRPGHRIPIPSLYHQRYSEQTFIGTHNSIAIRMEENNWSLSGNQYFTPLVQLESGVRMLQAQGHKDPNGTSEIRLCHFNCGLMDGGSLSDLLSIVLEFLRANPREIVTLIFVNTGPPLKDWAAAYYETGADLISFSPPTHKRYGNMRIRDWPTIAEMVESNARLVTFISQGADYLEVPFILAESRYLFETNFGIEAPDQYTCAPSRRSWHPGYIPDRLSLVNHFLYARFLGIRYPNASYANTTNGAGFHIGELGEHAARCRTLYGRRPNFLQVDFFNEGDVFDVEYGMNAY